MVVSNEKLAEAKEKIIVALDGFKNWVELGLIAEKLRDYVGCVKIGLQAITGFGSATLVQILHTLGVEVFYDGKFMDIPNTVAGASREVTTLGVKMFNLHCLGGVAMMRAALEASKKAAGDGKRPLILGVTLLTSLNYESLVDLGIFEKLNISDPEELAEIKRSKMERLIVKYLAWQAQKCGLDGVIASAQETKAIREYCGPDFLIVTPGIRPEWAAAGDQKRVLTPGDAIMAGADYLVIGRPITKPPPDVGGPMHATDLIIHEIAKALMEKEEK